MLWPSIIFLVMAGGFDLILAIALQRGTMADPGAWRSGENGASKGKRDQ